MHNALHQDLSYAGTVLHYLHPPHMQASPSIKEHGTSALPLIRQISERFSEQPKQETKPEVTHVADGTEVEIVLEESADSDDQDTPSLIGGDTSLQVKRSVLNFVVTEFIEGIFK